MSKSAIYESESHKQIPDDRLTKSMISDKDKKSAAKIDSDFNKKKYYNKLALKQNQLENLNLKGKLINNAKAEQDSGQKIIDKDLSDQSKLIEKRVAERKIKKNNPLEEHRI